MGLPLIGMAILSKCGWKAESRTETDGEYNDDKRKINIYDIN